MFARIARIKLLLALFWSLIATAAAGVLSLEGPMIQGGLVQGRTLPGTRIIVDGKPVRVSDDGVFLIGFDRDAATTTELNALFPDGSKAERKLVVERRNYDVQRIDGLPPSKVTPSEQDLVRIRAEAALARSARRRDDPRTDFLGGFRWPVVGLISGVYGSQRILNGEARRPHYGVDIAAPVGTEVRAPADGVVTLVHPDMYFSGGTLIVDHGHGLSSSFLHLESILVAPGERVTQGQTIAEVGATGRATGPHLDWRINWFTQRLDPALLVGPMPSASGGG